MKGLTVTYDEPARKPVKALSFEGPNCTSISAETDGGHDSFLVALGARVSDPASLYFDADAARAAAKFFERIATILDNGGYEAE